jgi:hypothetical protein
MACRRCCLQVAEIGFYRDPRQVGRPAWSVIVMIMIMATARRMSTPCA